MVQVMVWLKSMALCVVLVRAWPWCLSLVLVLAWPGSLVLVVVLVLAWKGSRSWSWRGQGPWSGPGSGPGVARVPGLVLVLAGTWFCSPVFCESLCVKMAAGPESASPPGPTRPGLEHISSDIKHMAAVRAGGGRERKERGVKSVQKEKQRRFYIWDPCQRPLTLPPSL